MKTIFIILILSLSILGQSDKPQANQWKGVILDTTNASQIIEKFGKPKSDKKDRIFPSGFADKELTSKLQKKGFRVMQYQNIDLIKTAKFVINEESKVVLIEFEPETKIAIQPFLSAYETIIFQPISWSFMGSTQSIYFLRGKTDNSLIAAMVSEGFFGSLSKKSEKNKIEQSNKTLTGSVSLIQLISLTLLDMANTDVLK